MTTRELEIFHFIANIFVVSFDSCAISKEKIALFLILSSAVQISCNIYSFTIYSKPFYLILKIYQQIFPHLIQIFVNLYNFRKRFALQEIENDIKCLEIFTQQKRIRKFLICFIILSVTRFLKIISIIQFSYIVHALSPMFSELVYACNDFIFIYYVELLGDHLKIMPRCTNNSKEISKNFEIMKKMEKFYSIPLLITISYSFGLMVMSFHWTVMRIIFGYLKTYEGIIQLNY